MIGYGHHFQAQGAYSGFQRAVVLDLQVFGGVDPAQIDVAWHPRHSGLLSR